MSLLQKASIITTPTAYAEDYLYSIKPAIVFGDEQVTNGDFESATGWSPYSGATISGGVAYLPNGGSYVSQNIGTVTGKTYKFTVKAKGTAGTGDLRIDSNGVKYTINNLPSTYETYTGSFIADGVTLILSEGGPGEIYIEDISVVEMTDADFDFTRASTATRVNEEGLIEEVAIDTPRIDFTGGTGSILLEPSSTNLVTYSEDFSQWLLIGITTTANAVISPDGLLNASKLVATSGSSNKVIAQGITANTYTASVFAKKGEFEGIIISTGTTGAFFNLNTNTYRTYYTSPPTSYNIENYGNGWYRYSITFTQALGDSIYIGPNDNVSTSLAITGNGTSGIYTFGAQLEALSYPTSYIPTNGSTQTRSADAATNAGNSDLINSAEGVLYTEIKALSNDLSERKMTLSDGTTTNTVKLQWGGTANQFYYFISDSSGNVSDIRYVVTSILDYHKVACKWKVNDFALWIDGVEVGTDTSGAVWAADTLTQLSFDNGVAGSQTIYSNVKCVAVFKEALTDAELVKLTS